MKNNNSNDTKLFSIIIKVEKKDINISNHNIFKEKEI